MERGIINKERASGMYRLSAYYMAKMTSEALLLFLLPVVYTTIVYWMVGLNGIKAFVPFVLTMVLHAFTCQVLTLLRNVATEHPTHHAPL